MSPRKTSDALLAEFEMAYRNHDALMSRYMRTGALDPARARHAGLVLTQEMIANLTAARHRMNDFHDQWHDALAADKRGT